MTSFLHDPFLLTPLAIGTDFNTQKIMQGVSALQPYSFDFDDGSCMISRFPDTFIQELKEKHQVQTRFDALLLEGVYQTLQHADFNPRSPECGILLASTKGNVELLEFPSSPIKSCTLHSSAALLAERIQHPNPIQVISNACISGISALIVAKRLVTHQRYKKILVIGCDVISAFIFRGFQSFKALDKERCKPFDLNRTGLNLGEAFASVVVSGDCSSLNLSSGRISNDSNHISGPSKSGDELSYCIDYCLKPWNKSTLLPDFIVAHGTATPYNDEMEAKAIALSGLHDVPVYSLKAIYGHTLGAAGLLETIIGSAFLLQNKIPPSFGFNQLGVPVHVTINTAWQEKPLQRFIKTGSGFGGCNAAICIEKV